MNYKVVVYRFDGWTLAEGLNFNYFHVSGTMEEVIADIPESISEDLQLNGFKSSQTSISDRLERMLPLMNLKRPSQS